MDVNYKKLIVIAGPTAVGKTAVAIRLAQALNTEIISCDSRQFYKEMNVGTAKPSAEELSLVRHHFIDNLSVADYYNVYKFENDVLELLEKLFKEYDKVIMVGGSGLYIDAVCNGIDDFPDPTKETRDFLKKKLTDEGIEGLQKILLHLDPEYYQTVDLNNPARLTRALEVCITLGDKYSKYRMHAEKKRKFDIVKVALQMPREQLVSRIETRVDTMMQAGLLEEVKALKANRNMNALNTVGYKEIFAYLDGNISLPQAVADIKTNTRRYAKRQMTWLRRDHAYTWFSPDQFDEIVALCNKDD